MINSVKQILRQFYLLIIRLPIAWKVIWCFLGLALVQAVFFTVANGLRVITNYLFKHYNQILYNFLLILTIFFIGLGAYLHFVNIKRQEHYEDEIDSDEDENDSDNDNIIDVYNTGNLIDISYISDKLNSEENSAIESSNVYTVGGNYNESIQGDYIEGDYIEIQGNYININQDFSEIATEIRELVNKLVNQGCSEEGAETQVADELAKQARLKSKLRKRLFKLVKVLNSANNKISDETEIAAEVVKSAMSYRYTYLNYFPEVTGVNYQKLDDLLRANEWDKADLETANIIYGMSHHRLPENSFHRMIDTSHIVSEHIKVISRKELDTINKLWIKHSKGSFGFSIQKHIWNQLGGGSDTSYTPQTVEEKFGDIVGWRKQGEWLYFVDLYEPPRTTPPGHFPLILMLYSSKVERCQIDFSILKVIVGRMHEF